MPERSAEPESPRPRLVPELYCSDFAASLRFYTEVVGFRVVYARPEERFAYLGLDGAELMIEQPTGEDRTWLAAELSYPFGRGVNLSIEVREVGRLYARVQQCGARILVPLEDRWYRQDEGEAGNRQFVVLDPDGYLLRPFQSLGRRECRVPGP